MDGERKQKAKWQRRGIGRVLATKPGVTSFLDAIWLEDSGEVFDAGFGPVWRGAWPSLFFLA